MTFRKKCQYEDLERIFSKSEADITIEKGAETIYLLDILKESVE